MNTEENEMELIVRGVQAVSSRNSYAIAKAQARTVCLTRGCKECAEAIKDMSTPK